MPPVRWISTILRTTYHPEACGSGQRSWAYLLCTSPCALMPRIFAARATRDGIERKRIANFAAWITAERIVDDGAERQKFMDIEAEVRGRRVRFTVPVAAFTAMNWPIEHIGADAVVEPGFGNKERVRAAIQYLSDVVPLHNTYAHTGWRQFQNNGWCYLHPGGAISAAGPSWPVSARRRELARPRVTCCSSWVTR